MSTSPTVTFRSLGLSEGLLRDLAAAGIIGTLLVLPFVILELTLGQLSYSSFPFGLFAILWLLPTTLTLVAAPVVRSLRSGSGPHGHPVAFVFRVAFLMLIAVFWIGLLNDQMPCFLGVPNCD